MTKTCLHVLVDSREASLSMVRNLLRRPQEPWARYELGDIRHVRRQTLADAVGELDTRRSATSGYSLLIAMHDVAAEHLEAIRKPAASRGFGAVHICTYDCFADVVAWCKKHKKEGFSFEANTLKRRVLPKSRSRPDNGDMMRVWAQYRLMRAIIARQDLGPVVSDVVHGKPEDGAELEGELSRATTFALQGEPDMAGGTYVGAYAGPDDLKNPINRMRIWLYEIAMTDADVLISGETGTGKETIAWSIHDLSDRRDRAFMALNCATLGEALAESTLFGHVKGAFTDAKTYKDGLVAAVDGGTLFLDELPDMPATVQTKLLRFLQSGEYRRLGEHAAEPRRADVRIIAAGQPQLLADRERLRTDLLSRVGQLKISTHPLAELPDEVILRIAENILERQTWTRAKVKNEYRVELTPQVIRGLKDQLVRGEVGQILLQERGNQANIRGIGAFVNEWLAHGDLWLAGRAAPAPRERGAEVMGQAERDQLLQKWVDSHALDELPKYFTSTKRNSGKDKAEHILTKYFRAVRRHNGGMLDLQDMTSTLSCSQPTITKWL